MIFYNEKTPFSAIKTRSSKRRKIDIFSEGLTHGFRQKMALFPTFFGGAIQARKMSLTIFYIENTPLQPVKTRSSRSRKIDIFPKGLSHGFGLKMAVFLTFIFQAIQARKMSFTRFQNEKTPFQGIRKRSSKSRKIDIFPNGLTHGFGLKMAVFPTFIFFIIQARKMCFTIFQNEKTPFQAIKTRSSKSRKIDIFPKGLTHSFGPKMARFPTFFYAIQARIMSFTILYIEKTPLQPIKTKSSKTLKTSIFPKELTHSYGPKLAIFPNFCFRQYRPGKLFFTIFQKKKTPFQAIKTRRSKSRKIDIFPKGLTHRFGPKLAIFKRFFIGNIGQENYF